MGWRKALTEQAVRDLAATYLRSYLGPTTRSSSAPSAKGASARSTPCGDVTGAAGWRAPRRALT